MILKRVSPKIVGQKNILVERDQVEIFVGKASSFFSYVIFVAKVLLCVPLCYSVVNPDTSLRAYKQKAPSDNCSGLLLSVVGLPRFELGQTEPKPVVLPLHHSPNLNTAFC